MTFETIDSRSAEPDIPDIEVLPRVNASSAAAEGGAQLCDCGKPLNHRGRHARAEFTTSSARGTSAATAERATQWSAEDMEVMQTALMMLLLGGTVYLQQRAHLADTAMRVEEAQAIAAPAVRMTLRHVHVKRAKRGDLADSVALASALLSYGLRVLAAWQESGSGVQHANGSASNGASGDDWTRAYRIGPEFASENGGVA